MSEEGQAPESPTPWQMPPPAGWPPPPPPAPLPPPYAAPQQWQPAAGWHASGGYPQPYGYARPGNTNGFCIAALVCSIVGVFFWFLGPVLGIVFGAVGLRQTTRLGESGRGLAIAGIVVGALMLLVNVGFLIGVLSGHTEVSTGVSV